MEKREIINTMEKNTITLSIIIPVYNTPIDYFKECLESITKSNIKYSYEVILINDGSTNQELIDFLNQYDEPHTQIIHKKNSGASNTRNIGLENAKGKYILCLDSDDILLSEINYYINYLELHPQYSVAYCDWQLFGDENYRYRPGHFSKFKHIYIGIQPCVCSLFRKDILQKVLPFNINFHTSEDWDFWARVASAGFHFKYLKTPFFLYRKIIDGKSLSQQKGALEHQKEVLTIGKKQFDPHIEITKEEVNKYVINNFSDNKINIIKMLIFIFLPKKLSHLFIKFKIFKNDIVID